MEVDKWYLSVFKRRSASSNHYHESTWVITKPNLYCTMILLPRPRCSCRSIYLTQTSKRSAHAATQPSDEGAAGPSNYYRRSTSTSSDTKGKSKDEGYRFPKKGRNGGEPDPFEILGIDRSSSQSEVKKQCTYPIPIVCVQRREGLIFRLQVGSPTSSGFFTSFIIA